MNLTFIKNAAIGPAEKSLPEFAGSTTIPTFLATEPRLSDLSTPLITLDDQALELNVSRMAKYCHDTGMRLAPHGKTTMAPQLWKRQLDAGAWGITVANSSQMKVAHLAGVPRIQLANALLNPQGLRQAQTMVGEGIEFICWADSAATVQRMADGLDPHGPGIDVLVELGGTGGRTGARGINTAYTVAQAIRKCPQLRLCGVSGYEGALAHDRSEHSIQDVASYLSDLRSFHERLTDDGLYETTQVYVTAGGSAYFDVVARELARVSDTSTTVLLRAGAYIIHDEGFYRMISPLSPLIVHAGEALRPAMHGWARVVSRPEPGLALLDAGKRDFPFDEGLPEPQLTAKELGLPTRSISHCTVTAMNDQHSFLSLPEDDPLGIGDVVRLGLSHPCTAFDKWRYLPVLTNDSEANPRIVDIVRTFF